MTSILLLGANGQVGFELRRALAPLGALICATRNGELTPGMACERADLADIDSLAGVLERARPTLIVNAAAYTGVDRAESEPELALRINADAVGVLGRWAVEHGAGVVHYSTDYVFAGNAATAYVESDLTAPLGSYGRSKLAGEQALAQSGAMHLIVRTAWVYAARGHNFLRTMLRLARERDSLRIVADQIGAPTPATLIAATTTALLARWLALDEAAQRKRSGVYHLTSSGRCSWFDFAEAIFHGAHAAGLLARVPALQAIGTADYPTPAPRPAWSVLDCSRLRGDFGLYLPTWRAGLGSTLVDLEASNPC